MLRTRHSALVSLAVLILVWAYSWILMKRVNLYAGPFDFVALRFSLATVALFAILLLRRQSIKPPPLALTIAVGLTQSAGFQALAQWALVAGGAGQVSLLSYTMPFWVILFAWWLLKDRPGSRQWFGIALAAIGLVCVMQPWQGLGTLKSAMLAVTGGGLWGFGTVLTKRMFDLHSPSPLVFTAWQLLFGTIALILLALIIPSKPIQWHGEFIYGLLYTGLAATAFAWLLFALIIKRLPANIAGLSSLGVPVMVVLMAWGLLAEVPSVAEWIGVIAIVSGLWVISLRPKSR